MKKVNITAKWIQPLFAAVLILLIISSQTLVAQGTERRISVNEYRDKMMGGWIGQMVGVGWGGPTEFRYVNKMIPDDAVPVWEPKLVNVWHQDDLYVEMTFLRSLEEYGLDVSMRQAGLDFANSKYMLWHANKAGRDNLRKGIAPPDCGHPQFNSHADDIDYQIEADFSGLIAPGLPNTAIALGDKFGRLMNYGDGLYAGQFVGGMYAEAFFEDDIHKIIDAGLKCIPEGSQYAEMVRDVVGWYEENPDDWKATWQLINEKYQENPDYRRLSCSGHDSDFNIDAKINGAYIVMGMLYGNSDLDQTTVISMQCGQDSDCNPSNAAGVLFTAVGYKNLPERFISALEQDKKFSYTEYSFPMLIDVCEKLARAFVLQAGGRIEKDSNGEDIFVIPVLDVQPGKLEKSWEPGSIAGTRFTGKEMPQIQWKWFFRLGLWLLFVLMFLLLKENRNLKALWILIPLIAVLALREILLLLIQADFLKEGLSLTLILTFSIGMCIMFLLGEKFKGMKWIVSLVLAILVFGVADFLGMLRMSNGFIDGTSKGFLMSSFSWAGTAIFGTTFTLLLCRKKFSNKRFLLFLLMWVVVLKSVLDTVAAASSWGLAILSQYFIWILIGGIISGLVQYLFMLPFWILAMKNKMYQERFRYVLKLPEKGKSK